MVQAQRTSANLTKLTSTELARCVGCLCTSSGWLKHSEPHRTYTSLTITELARCVGCISTRAGWFKHIEPHRTYTLLTITELARCVGCFCTSSGWFKHSEPQRTYTNHTSTELARCVGFLCTSSGGSSTANLHEPHQHSAQGVYGTSSGLLKHSEPQRTYRKHTTTELALCVGCFCFLCAGVFRVGSMRFDVLEPPRTTAKAPYTPC